MILYHCIEVAEAIDKGCFLWELLAKCIWQIVGWISWNKKDGFSNLGQLNSQWTGCGCFAYE